MNTKAVVILAAAAVVIGGAAIMLNRNAGTTSTETIAVPASLFPDLKARVNDVSLIEVKAPGETFSIARTPAGWGLSSKDGYPVKLETVKSAVVGIAELKALEAKTANPDLYSKIGVQDPPAMKTPAPEDPSQAPPADPTLVTLKDEKGATLASVVLGTQKWGNTPSVFVRKAGDKQSWLAEGRVEAPTDPMQWIERQVLNIGRERMKSVGIITTADGTEVAASRETAAGSFTVANIPPGRELTAPTAPESLITGVQYLSVDDIAPIERIGFDSPAAIAVYRTFDGLVVTARTVKKDEKNWVNLTFSFEEPTAAAPAPVTPEAAPTPAAPATKPVEEVKKEVEELSTKLSKWAFAVPEYKAKNFTATIETVLKPLTPAPTTPPGPDGPALPFPQPSPGALPGGG